MFLNFVFSLVFSFNVYAMTGGMPVLDDTNQAPCKNALTESPENSSEESEYILDQLRELEIDKTTEIKRAVDAYFSVRNTLMGNRYSDEEKLLAIELVKVMEGNVTGAAKLLDMSRLSLRRWTTYYEERTGTQIKNTQVQRTYSDEERTEAVELARKEGISEASRILGISGSTIASWLNKYKTKVVEHATEVGVPEAAKKFDVQASTIRGWMNERDVKASNYTKKEKTIKPVISLNTPNSSDQLNISRVTVHEGIEEPGVKIRDVYTEEFKVKAIELALKEGASEAGRILNTSHDNIRKWAEERGVEIKRIIKTYTDEFKTKVVEHATEVGIPEAANKFNVSTTNIHGWAKERGVKTKKIREIKIYTEEEKTKVIEHAKEVGAPKAAKEFNVSASTIRGWMNKRGVKIKKNIRKTYTKEFKTKVVERAKEVGAPKAAKEFNAPIEKIYHWANERGIQIKRIIKTYTEEFKTKAIERAKEVGAPEAAKEFDVSAESIRNWANKRGVKFKKIKRTYTEEFKTNAIERAKAIGVPKVAKELNVPEPTLRGWLRTDRENNRN